MTADTPPVTRGFLLGGRGSGGEEGFVRDLAASPPPGVEYSLALDPHESVAGARALPLREILLNRLVHPFLWPLPGFRAYDVAADVDLVHTHNFPVWLGARPGRPVVLSCGGSSYPHYLEAYLEWDPERVAARYRRADRLYRILGVRGEIANHDGVDAVVLFSDYAAGFLRRLGVPEEKLHVIPPGFDIPRPAPRGPGEGPFTFLLYGRHPVRKGADVAVEALARVRSRGVEARLVLVGDRAYPPLSSQPGIEGHGPVDRETLFRDYVARADAVLVPSRAEGFGFSAVEAMGHGVPVVASRRDALPWIVGDAGVLVEPGSVEALADAMAELATDRAGARERGTAGRARFEASFTREGARQRLGALYRHLLGRG